jgi:UPF0716 protein FxsA
MRLWFLIILLVFPILEIYLTVQIANLIGSAIIWWLICSIIFGWWLIRSERKVFREKTLAALRSDRPVTRSLLDSGRRIIAGLFFIFPGVLSDAVAVVLLLWPIRLTGGEKPFAGNKKSTKKTGTKTVEGEFRKVD